MKDSNEEHYTFNMQTHYTIQYRRGSCYTPEKYSSGSDGILCKIKYYLTLEDARTAIEKVFKDEHNYGHVEEATIIEWKKTPVLVKKNIKPVIESETTFDVEIYDRNESKWAWRVVEYGFETFKMAQDYVKAHTSKDTLYPPHRIIQRDMTVKNSIVYMA
jgi:hypothetical protein